MKDGMCQAERADEARAERIRRERAVQRAAAMDTAPPLMWWNEAMFRALPEVDRLNACVESLANVLRGLRPGDEVTITRHDPAEGDGRWFTITSAEVREPSERL